MRAIVERFRKERPDVRIDIQPVGSARGISDAQQGLADIGLVGRALRADEAGLHATVLARDAVAVAVHPESPTKSLTEAQVTGIFARTIPNWKEIGGSDAPITVVAMPEVRSATEVFLAHYKLKAGQLRADQVAPTSRQVASIVSTRHDAIGYIGVSEAAAGAPVRLLPCNGVEPTAANIANKSYPMPRPFLLVTRGPPKGHVKELIDFAVSGAVRDLLDRHSLVPPGN
jgi:phosphate transport system substrate-binding protein